MRINGIRPGENRFTALACSEIGAKRLSMKKLRIMSVFGTRPEAIKMCPLVKELASRPEVESLCCVTAQNRQMLYSDMEVYDVKPD